MSEPDTIDMMDEHELRTELRSVLPRLGALKSMLVELHDDHQDNDTFDAGVKYAAKMMLAAIDRETVVERGTIK